MMRAMSFVGPLSAALVLLLAGAAPSAVDSADAKIPGKPTGLVEEDDVCSLLKQAVDATGFCTFGQCTPAKTSMSCLIGIPDPTTGKAADNITATGEIVLCPTPGKPSSVKLTVGDTVLKLSKSKSWKSGQTDDVTILEVPVFTGLELDIDAAVSFAATPASASIGIGIDVCAQAGIGPISKRICGAKLLPDTLPLSIINDTYKIGTFCNPPPPPKPPAKPGHSGANGNDGSWDIDDQSDNRIYIAIAIAVGVLLMAVGVCYFTKSACFKDKGDQIDPSVFSAASNLQ